MTNHNKDNLSKDIFNTLPLVFNTVKKTVQSLNIKLAPNQIKILHLIHHGPTTINELAEKFCVTPPTMSETIDALVEKKLINKIKSTTDGRVTKISLTNSGKIEMTKAHKKVMSELDKKINKLSKTEKNIVFDALQILQKTFKTNDK